MDKSSSNDESNWNAEEEAHFHIPLVLHWIAGEAMVFRILKKNPQKGTSLSIQHVFSQYWKDDTGLSTLSDMICMLTEQLKFFVLFRRIWLKTALSDYI